jgi:hypothetical protein
MENPASWSEAERAVQEVLLADAQDKAQSKGEIRMGLSLARRITNALRSRRLLIEGDLKVQELKNCGNHAGLFRTVEAAMVAAQKTLDEYHEMYAEAAADPDDDGTSYEPLTTTLLHWRMERIDHHGVLTDHPDLGWPRLTARYSKQNGYFTIHEQEVRS